MGKSIKRPKGKPAGKKRKRKGMRLEERPLIEPRAAGIDIGAREIYVAVPPDCDVEPVRVFATFTDDLHRLTDWLIGCGVKTVAMESTGVYFALSSALFGRVEVPLALG
jgi:hypothetical protein